VFGGASIEAGGEALGKALPKGHEVHQKMDAARANFFWHGPNMKRKYHMVKGRPWPHLKKRVELASPTPE
jgi:hypothetical protein